MSIAEYALESGPSSRVPSQDYGRTPPQDIAAEQSVLGGMLLSKDAIADVVEVLRGNDFYRPAHELVYESVLDLYGRGEPADAVTVSAELTKRGELNRVGGAPYLHTLISGVPTAANAGYYARIVRERAVLRRLVEAGTKIVQLGYAADGGDVDEIVNSAQAEVYAVTERRASEDYLPLGEIIEGTIDEIEASSHRGDGMIGVPTGFADLDQLTNGLHPGQMIVIAARPAVGKALALDTPLPTPTGWTRMGQVRVGEQLLAADGTPTTVVAATDVMRDRPCYEVTFDDGTTVVADAQHQWLTDTRASRRSTRAGPAVRTTDEIAATLRCRAADARLNHSVRNARALDLTDRDLRIAPYTLGAWLGDGATDAARITTADDEMVLFLEGEGLRLRPVGRLTYGIRLAAEPTMAERACVVCGDLFVPQTSQVRSCGRSCGGKARSVSARSSAPACGDCGRPSSGMRRCAICHAHHGTFTALLRTVGVLGHKHIPIEYLRASEPQRRALLAGLLDTDGTVHATGSVQFAVTSQRLATDFCELLASLGYRWGMSTNVVKGRSPTSSAYYTITFTTSDEVFRLTRKQIAHKERSTQQRQRTGHRFIASVRRVESVPVRCVQIDHPDHLYLASRAMIPTHNSTIGLDLARSASIKHGMASVIFSLEMSRNEITMRLLSAEAKIPLQNMRKGTMREDDWTRLARTMGQVSEAPLFIDDSPNMSLMEIRAKCRRLKQRHDLKMVVVDYLQLMQSGKRVESRQQEVSEFSRALKLLAKEIEVPVIAISQLNRGSEQRTDKRPQMSDLRESGCLTADTRVLRADTGAEQTLGDLLASGERDVPVWSLDESLRYVRRHLTHVFSTGRKEVFRLRLASGKEVRATANHPFLTYEGWQPLGELSVGSRLAVPRHVPAPHEVAVWADQEVVRAANVIGGSRGTRVPPQVYQLPKRQISLFLRHLWATEGSVTVAEDGRDGRISYACTSRRLVDDVSRLLLRFGISTRIRAGGTVDAADGHLLEISGRDDQRRFLQEIGVAGAAGGDVARLLDLVCGATGGARADHSSGISSSDTVPAGVWNRVREVLVSQPSSHRERVTSTGRERLGTVAALLDDAELEMHAVNDVLWDTVVGIESEGVEEVFDATVLGGHNFVANGVAVHNSIEQDADMVILLHRDDMYDKESPRAGEADLIVAKHRNGPTDTITVAFQGHYSRFVDMASN